VAKKSLEVLGDRFDISYEILNQDKTKDFIVLHGWGSNKGLMRKSFAKFLPEFRHIYIDLPGFGNSTTDIKLDTVQYSNILNEFFKIANIKKDIILGHSFGGKVATLLSPDLLVLVGSSGILVPKPFSVRMKIYLNKFLKQFGITSFRKLFVSDDGKNLSPQMYETFKTVVNEDFSSLFERYSGKALLFWGKNDTATPLSTAKKINEKILNSKLFEYDGDHYFFMKHSDKIAQEIKTYIEA